MESKLVRSDRAMPIEITGETVMAGVYTYDQAQRGRKVYMESCAAGCHLESLGGSGPATGLLGNSFISRWHGLSVDDLFVRIRDTMPVDNPAGLSEDDYLSLTSYLLSANGFPAGTKQLQVTSAMGKIKIIKPK